MSEFKTLDINNTEDSPQTVPAFGYELIREVLLNDILGNEAPEILYWAGKSLARKYPVDSIEHIAEFFQKAGWGDLIIKKETKSEMELELYSTLIAERCKKNNKCNFQLEAGFIAQAIEHEKEVICEAFEHPRKKAGKVQITVKWDKKDSSI